MISILNVRSFFSKQWLRIQNLPSSTKAALAVASGAFICITLLYANRSKIKALFNRSSDPNSIEFPLVLFSPKALAGVLTCLTFVCVSRAKIKALFSRVSTSNNIETPIKFGLPKAQYNAIRSITNVQHIERPAQPNSSLKVLVRFTQDNLKKYYSVGPDGLKRKLLANGPGIERIQAAYTWVRMNDLEVGP